ncbi:MAG: hypothetical protein HYZ53_26710 [Planctomycetes bacterium]|nr:hypothetical protein [Planctomycetota bacterium]
MPPRPLGQALLACALLGLVGCGKDDAQPAAVHAPPGTPRENAVDAPAPSTPEPASPSGTAAFPAKPPSAAHEPGDHPPTSSNPLRAPGEYVEAVVGAKGYALVKIGLVAAKQRVDAFQALNDRLPVSLDEITKDGPLPPLPAQFVYAYDPKTGVVDVASSK